MDENPALGVVLGIILCLAILLLVGYGEMKEDERYTGHIIQATVTSKYFIKVPYVNYKVEMEDGSTETCMRIEDFGFFDAVKVGQVFTHWPPRISKE